MTKIWLQLYSVQSRRQRIKDAFYCIRRNIGGVPLSIAVKRGMRRQLILKSKLFYPIMDNFGITWKATDEI